MERKLVALFGGPRVLADGMVWDRFPTQRSALLLVRLALAPGKKLTRDALAEALWPDDFLDASRVRVRKELSRLREVLAGHDDFLCADRQFIWIDESRADVDVDLARALVRSAGLAGTPAECADRLGRARSFVAQEPVPGFSDEWASAVQEELQAVRAKITLEYAKALMAAQRPHEAIEFAREATLADPQGVEASKCLATALQATGLTDDAQAEIERLKRAMRDAGVDAPTEISLANPVAAPKAHHLIGREFELGYVTDLLNPAREAPCRLVTLVGPAGSGKTRLAEEATRVLSPLFPGGAFFLRLEDETDSAAIEVPAGNRILAVLDNGEQLLPQFAEKVLESVRGRADLWVLVTSIVPLGLVDETVVRLFPLPIPRETGDPMAFPSVRLFFDVARRAGHPLEPDRDTLSAVAAIARALEGWPLALVLAAGRTGVISPQEMATRLDELPELLKSRRLDIAERHRDMNAAVAWSLRLLSKDARAALASLATIEGAISRSQVEEALGPNALDVLENLMEWGAVERTGSTFRLPSPVRRLARSWDVSETIPR